ncbi:hypothetical protein Hrubri_0062 [Herbaspirillum rubrisubalbicans M1]|nr:hypothetical protein Hrubri_0062 [Herbaspirillum rubrisubalbicans M1]
MVSAMSLISSPHNTFCTKAAGPISAIRPMLIWRSRVSRRGPKVWSKMRMMASSSSTHWTWWAVWSRSSASSSASCCACCKETGSMGAGIWLLSMSALASPAMRLNCCTCSVNALISANRLRSGICCGISDSAGPAECGVMLWWSLRPPGPFPCKLLESIVPALPLPGAGLARPQLSGLSRSALISTRKQIEV